MRNNRAFLEKKSLPQKRQDPKNSLYTQAVLVFGINILCYLLVQLYGWLGDCAYALSVDVEMSGGFLQALCEVAANVFFYISSFLGTVAFFIGAAYIMRFAGQRRVGRSIGAAVVLFFGMCVTTCITIAVNLIVMLSGEYVSFNYMAVIYEFSYLALRVVLILLAGHIISRRAKAAQPKLYAASSAAVMFVCAAALELFDTTIPYFSSGGADAIDVMLAAVSYILYFIHALVGYIVVIRFFEPRKKQKTYESYSKG